MNVDFFRPGNSFLHRYDVRAKILLLAPVVASLLAPAPLGALAAPVIILAAVIVAAFGIGELAVPLRAILPVLIMIMILTPPFHREGRVLVSAFRFPLLTTEGVRVTAAMLLRFVGITFAFFAVFRSVEFDALMLGLRWFGLPFSACLVVIIAFRSLPLLAQTYRSVQDAHKLREGQPAISGKGRKHRVRAILPILTSVLIQAVKSIPVLAMVLESRGFGRSNRRSSFLELKKGRRLLADLALAAAISAAFLAAAFFPWRESFPG
jgi:energy-coupling factor transport system permease protein